jgi:hypothetical protein
VDFVDDINFEAGAGGGVFAGFAEFADLFDAVIGGAVDFEDIEGTALGDFLAAGVGVLEVNTGAVGAIEALGEDAGDGGFAGAARAAEEVGMGDAFLFNGMGEGTGDVFLSDNIAKALGPIFSSYDLV